MQRDIKSSDRDDGHAVSNHAPPPHRHREFVSIHNLRKVYAVDDDKVVALAHINLEIPRGQICCIFGESGSGKSTLLNQLAGMEKPTKGSVHIGHNNISQMDERELALFRQRHIGFVFQSYNLLPHLTAVENVAMPLMFCGVDKTERETKACRMLKRVGLGKRLKHFPSQMSGGQQQRVGIARAFIARPEVVFADEPTGNLDSKTKNEVMTMMCAFARHYRQTLVLVTHDEHMAQYADRIVTLLDGHIVGDVITENIAAQAINTSTIHHNVE
ncbi:ABC transporter ATP-binding protein [Bifidobacterium sp. ESL0704]|uniref:ABC transporter ATP-binding protein n=1 Tax=Bifidobacterium sp. ESL0704 TaxID=2983219 RepID=UPI0023F70910|nr:ABC transporter ATP-binding protein [Bifidobacterium sp. ESL0704]WEV53596.1 ABC transporter ATP-binding protein [Bifidobacterium sp. ESL0704]